MNWRNVVVVDDAVIVVVVVVVVVDAIVVVVVVVYLQLLLMDLSPTNDSRLSSWSCDSFDSRKNLVIWRTVGLQCEAGENDPI